MSGWPYGFVAQLSVHHKVLTKSSSITNEIFLPGKDAL
jgi:hypothetical protein